MNSVIRYCGFLILLASISCDVAEMKLPHPTHSIQLIKDLGTVNITLPERFDTLYQWRNTTDFQGGAQIMYRVADSSYSLLDESGFIYLEEPDSLYQFTITHLEYFDFFATKGIDEETAKEHTDYLIVSNYNYQNLDLEYYVDTLINHNKFYIWKARSPDNTKATLDLWTVIDSAKVLMTFECMAADCSSFISDMQDALVTISIVENP